MEGKRLDDIRKSSHSENRAEEAETVIPVRRIFASTMSLSSKFDKKAEKIKSQNIDRAEWYAEKLPTLHKLRAYPENMVRHRHAYKKKKLAGTKMFSFAVVFGLLILVLSNILPVSALVESVQINVGNKAKAGLAEIKLGQADLSSQKFTEAKKHFNIAYDDFSAAQIVIADTGQASVVSSIFGQNDQVYVANNLLLAAKDLSQAATVLTEIMQNFVSATKLENQATLVDTDAQLSKMSQVLSGVIGSNKQNLVQSQKIVDLLTDAQAKVSLCENIKSTDPTLENARVQLTQYVPTLLQQATSLNDVCTQLPNLAGVNGEKKYLVLFQNNTELRPSGGFLGSFATMLVKDGKIKSFVVETNIYKLDNTYAKLYHIDPPSQISKVNKDWLMRDSNWSVDFDTSARQVAWFYQQESGIKVDGVVAIDTTLISSLLEVVGSVSVPQDNITVTKDNFSLVLTKAIEQDYWLNSDNKKMNEPKSILADMVPILLQKVFQQINSNPKEILTAIFNAAKENHLLFDPIYITNKSEWKKVALVNSFPQSGDFLMVNNANLSGLKSSLNVNQTVSVKINQTSQNTLHHTIEITRTHTGTGEWPDIDNHNYLRLVVPANAKYVSGSTNGTEPMAPSEGVTVEKFSGYQTFGLWVTTYVKSTTTTKFEYDLPIFLNPNSAIEFNYIKQPGVIGDTVKLTLGNGAYAFKNNQTEFELFTRQNWQTKLMF